MVNCIQTPPKFDGLNFPIWKVKMTVFLQSLGSRVAKVVTKPFSVPIGDEYTWSDIATKEFDEIPKHTMLYFKLWTMTILLGSSIANPPTRYGHT